MKKLIALLLAAVLVCSLAACTAAPAADVPTDAELSQEPVPETVEIPAEGPQTFVEPLPGGFDAENVGDCQFPARITPESFAKTDDGYTATLDVLSEDLYDTVDFHNLKVGDIILVDGLQLVISSIEENNIGTVLKGEFAVSSEPADPEGYTFVGSGGGTMRVAGYDDFPTYTFEGTVTVPVAENFTFVDSAELDKDPVTYTGEDAIAALSVTDRDFYEHNTTALFEGGVLTQVDVRYVP